MRSFVAALALLVGLVAPTPTHRSTVAFELAERDLFPESIAFDPADGAYYVGSMVKRKIVRVAADGTATDFVPSKHEGLWDVLGMKIDPQRRELWLATCNLGANERPPMIDPEPESAGRTAVYRYDLRTAALIRRYEPQSPPARLCFNDLVLTPDGSVLLSSGPGGVWRIAEGGSAAELLTPADGMLGNGIAVSDDGATIWLAVHDRGIVAIDRATMAARVLPVPEGPHLMGIDGLYTHDGTLVGVQNGTKVPRIVRATLSSDGKTVERVEILEEDDPRFAVPTTGVLVDDALVYVATSQLDHIDPQTNTIWPLERLVPNVFLRLELGGAADAAPSVPQTTSAGGCAGRR
jgi:hypothetical protein